MYQWCFCVRLRLLAIGIRSVPLEIYIEYMDTTDITDTIGLISSSVTKDWNYVLIFRTKKRMILHSPYQSSYEVFVLSNLDEIDYDILWVYGISCCITNHYA